MSSAARTLSGDSQLPLMPALGIQHPFLVCKHCTQNIQIKIIKNESQRPKEQREKEGEWEVKEHGGQDHETGTAEDAWVMEAFTLFSPSV